MRLVPVNSIKEGTFLAKTIYDTDGKLLLAKGYKLTQSLLRKVEESGIMSLYINDEYSDNEIEDIIKPELRRKAIGTVKDSFENIFKFNKHSQSAVVNKKAEMDKKYEQIGNITQMADDIVDEIISQKNILINLVDIKSMDNYTYEHSINVTVLAIILGMELKYDKKKLTELAVGALLHDVGKVFIPKELLLKPGKLSDSEYETIKHHTTRGYEYIKSDETISFTSSSIALQHHERVDGTGYPQGIKEDKIYEYAKVVSIADVYDALTSDRPYRRAVSPNEAVEFIMGAAGRYFSYSMVNSFIKKIVPYPEGTIVRLSNGDIGVIEEINIDFPLRPRIKVIKRTGVGWEPVSVDLMKEKNLVIEGIQHTVP